jgi:DUF1680 family protein
MWNWRMLLITGAAQYADLMEWTLYNAILPGLSLDGQHYFYQNALADDGTRRREAWFGCACCPPNVARLLAQLPGYFFSVTDDAVWVHLYATGHAKARLHGGHGIELSVKSDYPWDGRIAITISTAGTFALMLRVPGWCDSPATIAVNGKPMPVDAVFGGTYARVERAWKVGDEVVLVLPMPPRRIESHPFAAENVSRVALARGPLLYCAEQVDNADLELRQVVLPDESEIEVIDRPDMLGGVKLFRTHGRLDPIVPNQPLYRTAQPSPEPTRSCDLVAVPYYAWANRSPGRMQAWMRRC